MDENGDEESLDIVAINPIEEKDKKIAALEKNVEMMKTKDSEIAKLKEELSKSTVELKTASTEPL